MIEVSDRKVAIVGLVIIAIVLSLSMGKDSLSVISNIVSFIAGIAMGKAVKRSRQS